MAETIHRWRGHVARLGPRADDMVVREIVGWIRHSERFANGFRLDFIACARQVADQMNPGTARNYRIATNALERYTHTDACSILRKSPHACRPILNDSCATKPLNEDRTGQRGKVPPKKAQGPFRCIWAPFGPYTTGPGRSSTTNVSERSIYPVPLFQNTKCRRRAWSRNGP